jgi:hypothetical protein
VARELSGVELVISEVGPGLAATLMRSLFPQPDAASTWAQHARMVHQLSEHSPQADAAGDLLAFTAFPNPQGLGELLDGRVHRGDVEREGSGGVAGIAAEGGGSASVTMAARDVDTPGP